VGVTSEVPLAAGQISV